MDEMDELVYYCINPWCRQRQNPVGQEVCQECGTSLFINERFRLLHPLRSLDKDTDTQVFEVVDVPGTHADEPGTHKVLKVLCSRDEKKIELMEREARVLRLLRHPGIPSVYVYDYFTFLPENAPFELNCIVLQKIEGQTLEAWIEREGRISQALALDWLRQLVEILDLVHQHNFFHRDIKPSNIMLKPDGQLVLIDFGAVRDVTDTYLAKVSGPPNTTGFPKDLDVTAVQSIGYSPQEQADGKALPQSDFYALGRTFVHLMTGVHPIRLSEDYDTGALLWREMAPQIDQPLINLIDEFIDKIPGRRPKNTQYILQVLSERIPLQLRWLRLRRNKLFWGVILAMIALLGFGLYQGVRLVLANIYFEQALEAEYRQEYQKAKIQYKQVLQIEPDNGDAYHNLANVCQLLKDSTCALENYQRAVALNPNRWETYYNLGRFYDDQNQLQQAAKNYRRSIELAGTDAAFPLNNLARIKILQRDYSAAIDIAQQGLNQTQEPQIRAILFKNLGWALFELKQYSQAELVLQQSQALSAQKADSYCLLAQVQEALNQIDAAAQAWETCLLLGSDLPEVTTWKMNFIRRLTASPL